MDRFTVITRVFVNENFHDISGYWRNQTVSASNYIDISGR